MRKSFLLIPLVILILTCSVMAAEHPFGVKADIRYRWEYEDHFNQKYYGNDPPIGQASDGFLLQRIRLSLGCYPSKNIHLSVGLQDSRAYNVALKDEAFYNQRLGLEHNPNKDYLEPFDTYLELKNLLGHQLSLKVGRQTIAYGDKRIFGPGQWGNTGRYIWDAAKFSYAFGPNFIDAFYGYNIIHDPDRLSLTHRHFFGCLAVYSHFLIPFENKKVYLEPFWVRKWDHHDNFKGEDGTFGDFRATYYGLRTYAEILTGLEYAITYVWQQGHWGPDDLRAYGYHILLGYSLKTLALYPRLSVEYSYSSGDSDPTDGKRGTLDGVFGARDRMYGRMNLMDWKNLKDAQINLDLKPIKGLTLRGELHRFWLAEEKDAWYLNPRIYRDKTGRCGDDLGMEIDICARYLTHVKGLSVQFGYGHFWPGDFVKRVADDSEANWYFFQLRYQFSKAM